MRLTRLITLVWFVGEMRVAELVAQLPIRDLAVVNRDDEIVGRAAKMLANRAPVFSNCGNLHVISI